MSSDQIDEELEFNHQMLASTFLPSTSNCASALDGKRGTQGMNGASSMVNQSFDKSNLDVSLETIDHVCISQGVHSQEINQFLGYSWDVESKVTCSKRRAEGMAEELLKRDSPPLTSEVLQMLNLWKFKSNPYRKNVMPYDWKFVYSENYGMSTSRNGIFFSCGEFKKP